MTTAEMKDLTLEGFERMFHQGDLDYVDEVLGAGSVDHQEPAGAQFCEHLKQVVVAMRTAFPDVHFEVHELLAEGDVVACRSTMTGTHLGHLGLVPPGLDATGRRIEVSHMHFFRFADGRVSDLWHLWDTPGLLRQLGASPQATR
jgi:steroid delta-isomerase-like uncharacterized protein